MAFRRRRREEEGINATPLVDVMFNLLIFVIVTAQYSHLQSIKVNLPKSRAGAAVDKGESITLTLTRDELILLNQQPVTLEALKEKLTPLARREIPPKVMLQADEGSRTGKLVELMDLASPAGLKKISIETRKAR